MNDSVSEKAGTLQLTALLADDGDCLILTYGSDPRRHVVVDGGRSNTYPHLLERMKEWVGQGDRFMLLVVTHFNGDHIDGVLRMVKDPTLPVTPEQVRAIGGAARLQCPSRADLQFECERHIGCDNQLLSRRFWNERE